MVKIFGARLAGYLICLVAVSAAFAQSDTTKDAAGKTDSPDPNSKPADPGTTKADPNAKNPFKTVKPKSTTKPTGKKTGAAAKTDGSSGDPAMSDDTKNADGTAAANGKVAAPNWSVDQIKLAPFAGAKYTKESVNIEPTKGQTLVQATFEIEAIRADGKAYDKYSRSLNANDRKELTRRAQSGIRVLEAKSIALRAPDGKQYFAIWSPVEGVRTTIVNIDIAPNRQSTQTSTSGSLNPNGPWLEAEQSFITRITRPFNQPPVTEYSTMFRGILRAEHAFPMTMLFSVPENLDLQTLKLVVESDSFAIGQ